ncbi:MAG: DUF6565 domain-containing protein [Prolixibacteraceae bacterium]
MNYFRKFQHKVHLPVIITVTLCLFLSSCLLLADKKTYISRFEKFVDRVEKEHEKYDKRDWEWADSQFEKFSETWYEEYRDELTLKEKLKVQMLIVHYESIRGRNKTEKRIREYLKEDAEELKEKMDEYLKEDAGEDLRKLKEGMKEIGDSAVKVFEDIVKSLEKKLDE